MVPLAPSWLATEGSLLGAQSFLLALPRARSCGLRASSWLRGGSGNSIGCRRPRGGGSDAGYTCGNSGAYNIYVFDADELSSCPGKLERKQRQLRAGYAGSCSGLKLATPAPAPAPPVCCELVGTAEWRVCPVMDTWVHVCLLLPSLSSRS